MLNPREKRIQDFKDNIAHQLASDTLFNIVKKNIRQHGQIYPCFTLQTIEQNINADWVWDELVINPHLTLEFITKHVDKFNKKKCVAALLYYMCPITGINGQDIYNLFPIIQGSERLKSKEYACVIFHECAYWSYLGMCEVSKDPFKFIKYTLDCEYTKYSCVIRLMDWVFNIYIYEKYMAAYKIQQWWFKILTNPYHKVGKRFIEKQYDKLVHG